MKKRTFLQLLLIIVICMSNVRGSQSASRNLIFEDVALIQNDPECFTPAYLDKKNVVSDPYCSDVTQFGGWGGDARFVNTDPDYVFCGSTSIAVGSPWKGTFEVNNLLPNTVYRFIAQTYAPGGSSAKFGLFGHGLGDGDVTLFESDEYDVWKKADFTFKTVTGGGVYYVGEGKDGNVYIDNYEVYVVEEPFVKIQYEDLEGNKLKEDRIVKSTWGTEPKNYFMIGKEYVTDNSDREEFILNGYRYEYVSSDKIELQEGCNVVVLKFEKKDLSSAEVLLSSPNAKIEVNLHQTDAQSWYLSLCYNGNSGKKCFFPVVHLGLEREDASFKKQLELQKMGETTLVREDYVAIHGKRKHRINEANERSICFKNESGNLMNVIVRAYNDGVCFRYEFPESSTDSVIVKDEFTSYEVTPETDRWMQHFVTSYEGEYPHQKQNIVQGEWGYPSLLKLDGESCWALLSEADVDRNYCATKLSNQWSSNSYKLTFPDATDGNGTGSVYPKIQLPWKSPWRVVIMGELNDVVESTLVEDVSEPNRLPETDWIQPGLVSWIYWANNHGTKDYKLVCDYVDLAANMGWPYVLFDWEWDQMANGGTLEDAVKYALSKGVKPMIWLNSGGDHNRVSATPRDRLITHEARVEMFKWLNEIGVYGIKVDFFESDKQQMIRYYLDILEDAAVYKLMVNFHGSTVPRGWSRTYPHLMSMEAVYGAEQYNNTSHMTDIAATLNATLPYTRNVVGPMDYTPVTFTDSQNKHITSNAHELALSVIFESALQHMADRPQGFYDLPDAAKDFLRHLPTAWDHSYLIDGYPGEKVLMRRERTDTVYVAGINGTNRRESFSLPLGFLPDGMCYKLLLIADGKGDRELNLFYSAVKKDTSLSLSWLERGGFSARLTLLTQEDLILLLEEAERLFEFANSHIGTNVGEYKSLWVLKLGETINKVKNTTSSLFDKYVDLGEVYSEFCNEALVTEQLPEQDESQDVTVKYLKELRSFSRIDQPVIPSSRWGLLADPWVVTPEILNQENNSRGGYDNYNNTRSIGIQKWESSEDGIQNGQIFQTSFSSLPAGKYRIKISVESQYGLEDGEVYLVVARGDTIPFIDDLSKSLAFSDMKGLSGGRNVELCDFTVENEMRVTVGWLANISAVAEGRCLRVNDIRILKQSSDHADVYNDVTAMYLKNYTNIERKDLEYSRFGIPLNWEVENFEIPQTDGSGTKQGIDKYSGRPELMMGVWDDISRAKGDLSDAKIYQKITLPAGTYYVGAVYQTLYNLQKAYLVVSEELPSFSHVEDQSLAYYDLANGSADGKFHGMYFTLSKKSEIYVGWVADLKSGNARQELRVTEIKLMRMLDSPYSFIGSEAFSTDSILNFSLQEFAQIGGEAALTADNQHYLKGSDGASIQLGTIDFGENQIEEMVIKAVSTDVLTENAFFEVYLDQEASPLCKIPAVFSSRSTAFVATRVPFPIVSGVHDVRVLLNGHASNIMSIEFIPYFFPDAVSVPYSSDHSTIFREGNQMIVSAESGTSVSVYTMSGVLIRESIVIDGYSVLSLESGAYIVRVGDRNYKFIN